MMRNLLALLVVLLAIGCASSPERTHKVTLDSKLAPQTFGDDFDWQRRSPLAFLRWLKAQLPPRTPSAFYIVHGRHEDWIRDADIEPMMRRLDSETPCAFVISTFCSQLPTGHSTEGREAAFLIEGYRRGFYPPELSSAAFQPNVRELRQWYAGWRTRTHK